MNEDIKTYCDLIHGAAKELTAEQLRELADDLEYLAENFRMDAFEKDAQGKEDAASA